MGHISLNILKNSAIKTNIMLKTIVNVGYWLTLVDLQCSLCFDPDNKCIKYVFKLKHGCCLHIQHVVYVSESMLSCVFYFIVLSKSASTLKSAPVVNQCDGHVTLLTFLQ